MYGVTVSESPNLLTPRQGRQQQGSQHITDGLVLSYICV